MQTVIKLHLKCTTSILNSVTSFQKQCFSISDDRRTSHLYEIFFDFFLFKLLIIRVLIFFNVGFSRLDKRSDTEDVGFVFYFDPGVQRYYLSTINFI